MSIKYYMDENVPGPISKGLRNRGIDILRVQDDGYQGVDDSLILDHALEEGRVVFSCDDDFLRLAEQRQRSGVLFAGVVYIHQEKISIGRCIEDLAIIAEVYTPEDMENHVERLPL